MILAAYRAEKTAGFNTFHGKKAGRLVAVGPINLPVTRLFVEEVILECRQKHITRVDILGFEFEMGLFPNLLDEARAKGIRVPGDLRLFGFGDLDFAAHADPALSTVRIDGTAIGRQAARFILERIAGGAEGPRIVDLGFAIVPRDSA